MAMIDTLVKLGWKLLSNQKKLSYLVGSLYSSLSYAVNLQGYNSFLKKIETSPDTLQGQNGVNIAGHFTTESGAGVAARSFVRTMERTSVPFVLNNYEEPLIRSNDQTYRHLFTDTAPYDTSILFANADQVPSSAKRIGPQFFVGKYTIGYWLWELESFPIKWRSSFRCLDEIWTQSTFCANAIQEKTALPVITIPHSIDITDIDASRTRESFGLREDSFVFLYIFSLQSTFERKNPLAVISAFRKAFSGLDHRAVTLVLKLSGSSSHQWAYNEIIKASEGLPVLIIDSYLDNRALYRLMQLSDCCVSLHRAEGFGLTIAESMFLGKPCVATAYSGNMDFMNDQNSFPVKYAMKKIEHSVGPYKKGNYWADPDQDHAADLMRSLYEHKELGKEKGRQASQDIRDNLSPTVIARTIQRRLQEIHCV